MYQVRKNVTTNSKAISCDLFNNWTHVKCSSFMSIAKYNQSNSDLANICDKCTLGSLPFSNDEMDNITDTRAATTPDGTHHYGNPIHQYLQQKGLHFVGINARSLTPKLEELRLLPLK